MALKDNTSDVRVWKPFWVLTGSVVTIVGVILCCSSLFCYHQGNGGKGEWKTACCF